MLTVKAINIMYQYCTGICLIPIAFRLLHTIALSGTVCWVRLGTASHEATPMKPPSYVIVMYRDSVQCHYEFTI